MFPFWDHFLPGISTALSVVFYCVFHFSDPPQKVTDISCQVYDWDTSLTCSWNYGVEYIDDEVPMPQSPDINIDADVKVDVSLLIYR